MKQDRPITQADKIEAFKAATSSLVHWYGDQLRAGMTDEQLEDALGRALGIMGGRGGPDCISVAYQGAGLKIWASWSYPNIVTDRPLFQGRATVSMAREIYRIPDPANRQQSLF